ncbi:MAG: GNAT family N-acetyltransferase [Lachnospiraceae bacterium]
MELLGQTKFEIRVMTIDDYEKVYSLWMSCKNMGFNNLDDSREGIAKYLKRNPSTCFVAEQGENIVGVILSGHDGRRGFIHHLAVAEDCRRQGIATELLECAVSSLAAEGINKVALLVFNRNEAGNAFWEKNGFTCREDLVYRNKALVEMVRIDT